MQKRDLDAAYFRVERNGHFEDLCFTDLTNQERDRVCQGRSAEWFRGLAYHLADILQAVGEEFDIYRDMED